jgi:hypothetical protein
MKATILTLCLLLVASAAIAETRATHTVFGIDTHPYAALEATRPSGPDTWSVGFAAGVELDFNPFWIGLDYQLHDVLDEAEVYGWGGTFTTFLGLYKGDGESKLFEIPTYPYAAFVLARPSGPDEWSPGFVAGLEVDASPLFIGVDYTLRDILSDEETYKWDGEFAVKLGAYW